MHPHHPRAAVSEREAPVSEDRPRDLGLMLAELHGPLLAQFLATPLR